MSTSNLLQAYDENEHAPARPRRRRAAVVAPARNADDILTLEELALAIEHRIGLPTDDAARDAAFIMDIFGFDDRVIDNVLEREDRQLFYILEEVGMLTTDREETVIWDGREWRTHYWCVKKTTIKRYADLQRAQRRRREPSDADIYLALPPNAWTNRRFA